MDIFKYVCGFMEKIVDCAGKATLTFKNQTHGHIKND